MQRDRLGIPDRSEELESWIEDYFGIHELFSVINSSTGLIEWKISERKIWREGVAALEVKFGQDNGVSLTYLPRTLSSESKDLGATRTPARLYCTLNGESLLWKYYNKSIELDTIYFEGNDDITFMGKIDTDHYEPRLFFLRFKQKSGEWTWVVNDSEHTHVIEVIDEEE